MADYQYESPYGMAATKLQVQSYPRIATIELEWSGHTGTLQFDNPSPLSPLTELFDELIQFRIIDRNVRGEQRDFGRYIVEVWDEDNPFTNFEVDGYSTDDASVA